MEDGRVIRGVFCKFFGNFSLGRLVSVPIPHPLC